METLEVTPEQAALFRKILSASQGLADGALVIVYRDSSAFRIEKRVSELLRRRNKAEGAAPPVLA